MKINDLKKQAHENAVRRGAYDCPDCKGFGKEICNNPDHGFIESVGYEIYRLGCPACGHDENHLTNYDCDACNGTGKTTEKNIISKLREEVEEFAEAVKNDLICTLNKSQLSVLECASDYDFKDYFVKKIKNTTGDELADIILVALAGSEELNIDIESHLQAKQKYNEVRED